MTDNITNLCNQSKTHHSQSNNSLLDKNEITNIKQYLSLGGRDIEIIGKLSSNLYNKLNNFDDLYYSIYLLSETQNTDYLFKKYYNGDKIIDLLIDESMITYKFDDLSRLIDLLCKTKDGKDYLFGEDGKFTKLFKRLYRFDQRSYNLKKFIEPFIKNEEFKKQIANYLFGEDGEFINLLNTSTTNNLDNLIDIFKPFITDEKIKKQIANYLFGEDGTFTEVIKTIEYKERNFDSLKQFVDNLNLQSEFKNWKLNNCGIYQISNTLDNEYIVDMLNKEIFIYNSEEKKQIVKTMYEINKNKENFDKDNFINQVKEFQIENFEINEKIIEQWDEEIKKDKPVYKFINNKEYNVSNFVSDCKKELKKINTYSEYIKTINRSLERIERKKQETNKLKQIENMWSIINSDLSYEVNNACMDNWFDKKSENEEVTNIESYLGF